MEYWQNKGQELSKLVKKHSTTALAASSQDEYNRTKEIAANIDAILAFFGDSLSPSTREEFETWIQSYFPATTVTDSTEDVSDVYGGIVSQIDEILARDATVRTFLSVSTTGLLVQSGGVFKLTAAATSGSLDLATIFKGISESLKGFSGNASDWRVLGDICGGLVVLGIDPQWVVRHRKHACTDSVEFPADDEVVFLGDGRQANLLHLVSCAVAGGLARLEKVFGKPAIDERRVPDMAVVAKGIAGVDQIHEAKLHFIRFVLPSEAIADPGDKKLVELKFVQTQRIITAAFQDDKNGYLGSGQSFKSLKDLIRKELKLQDFLLIHPDGDDPERLLNSNVRVLRFLGKIYDAVQAHTAQ